MNHGIGAWAWVPNQEGRDVVRLFGREEGLDAAAARVKRRVALCDCVRDRGRERRRLNCDGLRFTV